MDSSKISEPFGGGQSSKSVPENISKVLPFKGLDVTNSQYNVDYILSIILDWNTEWLTQSSDSNTPNQLSPFGEGTGIKTCYKSLEEYQSAYIPLILMETWAQIYNDFNNGKPFDFEVMRTPDNNYNKRENCDNFMTLNLQTADIYSGIGNYPTIEQLLILEITTDDSPSNKKVFGYVVKRERIFLKFYYVVAVSKKSMTMFETDRENQVINAKAFHYLRQTVRQIESISKLNASPLLKDILEPRFSVSDLVVPKNLPISYKLNESQSRAVLGITEAVHCPYVVPKLVFIQGPPGTGKTFTLIETLKHIYMTWDSEKRLPRILICAPSNGAVNEISQRIYKERDFLLNHPMKKYRRALRCVRVGIGSKIQGVARIIWLENLVKGKDSELIRRKRVMENRIKYLEIRIKKLDKKMEYQSHYRNKKGLTRTQMERTKLMNECQSVKVCAQSLPLNNIEGTSKMRDIMNDADIVLSTLNSSHSSPIESLYQRNGSQTFDCVIVDEASQCSEPELLMPLVYQMSKMILIGDPKQLPATVISKKASGLDFGRSLFERFYNHFLECEQNNPNQKSPVLMFREQYRMHQQICQFPSKQFYCGKLTTSSEVMGRNFNRLKPYILFDVSDTIEKSDPTKKSKLNLKEANFVIRLATIIDKMLNKSENNQKEYTVGVITPYNGQKNHLNYIFKNKYFENVVIDVNTIDGFQGQERDVIIFSSVRAFNENNKHKSIGFLDSVQRMNVSLTRAKYSMILCISGHTLQRDKTWKCLIDDSISRRNIHFEVSSERLSSLKMKEILAPIQ